MIEENNQTAPSLGKIAVATVIALVVAGAILAVAVLPAEYGIDPLGTGKRLGLMDMAKAGENAQKPQVPTEFAESTILPILDPKEHPSKWGESGVLKGAFLSRPERFNFDSREITIEPGQGKEYKYNMKKGSGLVFSWVATKPVLYDFHGQPDVKPEGKSSGYFESYDRDDKVGKDQLHGTLVATRTGIHGWYWENTGSEPVTIKLIASGFFDWVFQNVDDKETALKPIDAYSLPSHPKMPDEVLPH